MSVNLDSVPWVQRALAITLRKTMAQIGGPVEGAVR